MTSPALSLHRKLAEVMAEAERIPKNGTAPAAMGGFKFVQVGDAADVIRKALATRKVSMIPSSVEVLNESEHETRSGGTMTTMTVRTTWTLVDGESGETAVIQSLGTGADSGDKYSPKAQTNAMKYALLMGFLLSTGDDPELTDSSDRKSRGSRAPVAGEVQPTPDGSIIGKVAVGNPPADFEIRESADGSRLSFRLEEGKRGIRVDARGLLVDLLAEHKAELVGKNATCWGTVIWDSFEKGGKAIPFRTLALTRIQSGKLDFAEPEEPDQEETEAELVEQLAALLP